MSDHVFYRLDLTDNSVHPCSMDEWQEGFPNRQIMSTGGLGDAIVSTIFLGVNMHIGQSDAPPLLFETMVFGGPLDGTQYRTGTYSEAIQAHRSHVDLAAAASLRVQRNTRSRRR